MNRIDRLMGIITLLQSKKQQGIEQLADHYGVSERTIFRDLRAISEIGIPVYFEADKGYSVGDGFFLPPVSLTSNEAHALTLAEPLIIRFADKSVQKHFSSALSKIKMVLDKKMSKSIEQVQAQTAHFVPDRYQHLMPNTDYLTQLQSAIIEKKIVTIEYQNLQEQVSKREIEPIGLTFYSLNWHLVAWCHLRNEYRDFRVSRIQTLKISLQSFRIASHLSLNEYLQEVQTKLLQDPNNPLT
jgi:predicted DNA-binding transcriptional regulator YafY